MAEQNINELVKGINSLVDIQKKEQLAKSRTMFSRSESLDQLIYEESVKTNELLEGMSKEDMKNKVGMSKIPNLGKLGLYGGLGAGVILATKQILKLKDSMKEWSDSLMSSKKVVDGVSDSWKKSFGNKLDKKVAEKILSPEEATRLKKQQEILSNVNEESSTNIRGNYVQRMAGSLLGGDKIRSKTAMDIGLFDKYTNELMKGVLLQKFRDLSAENLGRGAKGGELKTTEEIVKQAIYESYNKGKIGFEEERRANNPPLYQTIGSVSALHERGKTGNASIVSEFGSGDYGGASFGNLQLASRNADGGSNVNRFLSSIGEFDSFRGLDPNASKEDYTKFSSKWKDLVKKYGATEFEKLEKKYLFEHGYKDAYVTIKDKLGIDVNKDKALQELLWSTVVQHGKGGAVALFSRSFGDAKENEKLSTSQIIKGVMGERGRRVTAKEALAFRKKHNKKGTKDYIAPGSVADMEEGELRYFFSSSRGTETDGIGKDNIQANVANRYPKELNDLLALTQDNTTNSPSNAIERKQVVANSNIQTKALEDINSGIKELIKTTKESIKKSVNVSVTGDSPNAKG